jgi:hypothetical protein
MKDSLLFGGLLGATVYVTLLFGCVMYEERLAIENIHANCASQQVIADHKAFVKRH